jgi:hypothetical protein
VPVLCLEAHVDVAAFPAGLAHLPPADDEHLPERDAAGKYLNVLDQRHGAIRAKWGVGRVNGRRPKE